MGMANPQTDIYLDHNATTPLDPRVLAAMVACWEKGAGNPHSANHRAGWRAAERLEEARRQVARLFGCGAECVIFTSGATEASSLSYSRSSMVINGRVRTGQVTKVSTAADSVSRMSGSSVSGLTMVIVQAVTGSMPFAISWPA